MKTMNLLQTLDRGIQALEIIAQHASGITIAELAAKLDIHRAIVYRIVSTLEAHALVSRTAEGQIYLGGGLLVLASRFEPQLRSVAQPMLHELAKETRATAFISLAQGEECVVIMVAEPEEGLLRVGYRVGSRHPLALGAAGIAILAGRPERPDEPDAVRQARRDGFSLTRGQLHRGAVGIASSIHSPAQPHSGFEASVGVVAMEDLNTEVAIAAVTACARKLAMLIHH
jgi:DNA-binding IclR family transcriptional regulator